MTLRASYYLSPALSLSDPVESASPLPTWESEIQYADELSASESEHLYWTNRITPQIAASTIAISQKYPWLSPGVATGAAFAGIEPEDPALKWLADREAAQADHGGVFSAIGNVLGVPFTMLKGATRLATTGFDMLWEEGLSRPLRTAVGIGQNIGNYESYQRAGASIGTRAIGDLFGGEGDLSGSQRIDAFVRNVTPLPSLAGQGVNLGAGYLPSSNLASGTDRQVQALTELLIRQGIPSARANAQAVQSVQQSHGQPITQQARQQAETGIRIKDRSGARVSISPGRLGAVAFGMDSDTTAFNVVSGIGDFAAQIFLDPSNIALAGISKARLASRLLTNGNRTGRVFGQNVDQFTKSAFYTEKLTPRLAEIDNIIDMKNALGLRGGANTKEIGSTRRLMAELVEEKNPGRINEILQPHLGTTVRRTPKPENVATLLGYQGKTVGQQLGGSQALYRALGSSGDEAAALAKQGEVFGLKVGVKHRLEGTYMGRLFSETSDRMLDTEDMDSAWFSFDNFLNNAGFSAEAQNDLLMRFAKLGDADHQGAFQVMKSAMEDFKTNIVDGLVRKGNDPKTAEAWAHSFTRMYESQDDWVKYWLDQSGNHAIFPSGKMKVVSNGEIHMIEMKPTVHMISEMVSRQLPMPDPREMRRLMSEVGGFPVSKLTARRTLKHGTDAEFNANVMSDLTDFYMQKVWKPMVLLRFAWPVRVIGEEQFRMAAAGKYSALNHPMQWLAFASGRKGNRTLMRELPSPKEVETALRKGAHGEMVDLPQGLDDFYSALAASHGGWLNTRGQIMSVAGYTTVSRTDPNFVDALVWNIGKLNANDSITRRIRADGIDETAKWLHSGKGKPTLRKLADAQDAEKLRSYEDVHRYVQSVDARIHVTAGGGYMVWDDAALQYRDHFGQLIPPESGPPPPAGFDLSQPPLEGIQAGRHTSLKTEQSPGLGNPSFREPTYGRQGEFDTDFQPRIQREKQGDYRVVDRWLNGEAQDVALREGRVPGVFGDSIPLDRTWGQYAGDTDYQIAQRLATSLTEWSGYSQFDKLGFVDETMDLLFDEALLRAGGSVDEVGVTIRNAVLPHFADDTQKGIQAADDLADLVNQYSNIKEVRSLFDSLDRVAGIPVDPMRALDAKVISIDHAVGSTRVEVGFVSALMDEIAQHAGEVTFRELDQFIDDAAEMVKRSIIDPTVADRSIDNVARNLKAELQGAKDGAVQYKHGSSWDGAIDELSPNDFVPFRDPNIHAMPLEGKAERHVTAFIDGDVDSLIGTASDIHLPVKAAGTSQGMQLPQQITVSLNGQIPEFGLMELYDAAITVVPAKQIKTIDDVISYGLNAYREGSDTLGFALDNRGWNITMDGAAETWFRHLGIEGADDATGWRVPGSAISDKTASELRTGPLDALGRNIENEVGSVYGVESVFRKAARDSSRNARDDLQIAARGMRSSMRKELEANLFETIDEVGYGLGQALNSGAYGGKSTRGVVSEILQYGQTWKGSTLHKGDAAIEWSSEVDSLIREMTSRRIAAISEGKIDAFDDDVLDALFEIADSLNMSPTVLFDEWNDAIDTGLQLSQAGLDVSGAGFRSPMGQMLLPRTVADEMGQARYGDELLTKQERAAAWDTLGDDDPVFVYTWMSQEEAHKVATEGWDGRPLLVSANPDVAQYYTVPLTPTGEGLPGLGHGRIGPPLEGVLLGNTGAARGNLYGPGLYSTSHGGVLGGYTGGGTFGKASISQLNWVADEPANVLDLNVTFKGRMPVDGDELDSWLRVSNELDRIAADPPAVVRTADDFNADEYAEQMNAITNIVKVSLDKSGGYITGDDLISAISNHSDMTAIAVNEAIGEAGFDALSHVGGVVSGGDSHRVFVWLWKSLREGKLEGAPITRTATPGGEIPRAFGSAENANKLVSMRVRKGDVSSSYRASPNQTAGDAMSELGMGGQIERKLNAEEIRFVDHQPTELEHLRLGADPELVGTLAGTRTDAFIRNSVPNYEEYVSPAIRTSLDEARARGLRVQVYTATDGDSVALSVTGGRGKFLDAKITAGGGFVQTDNAMNAFTIGPEQIPRLLNEMPPPAGNRALFTSANQTTDSGIGTIRALDDLPEAEAAVLRSALDDMPPPPERLREIEDLDIPQQAIEPPDAGPPKPTDFGTAEEPVASWYHKTGEADEGILDLIFQRRHKTGTTLDEAGKEVDEFVTLPGEIDTMSDELRAYLKNLETQGKTPEKMPYRSLDVAEDRTGLLDNALNVSFYHMMSRPTNYLSRSPAWKQSYIQRVLELRSFAVPKVQKQIDELLYGATADKGFGLTQSNARHILGRTPIEVGDHGGTLKSMRTIDDLAKAFALEETKNLLYDASKRHNITDITRNIFPFAEAWAEVIGVWGRIAFEHPEVLRRAQQGLEGARESGFFYTNENGDEVFAYPGLDVIGNWMLGNDTSEGQGVKFTGRTGGLNIALGGFLPGFGPTVQLPVSMAEPHMPIGWDWVSDMVLPFGSADVNFEPGDLLNMGLPAWYRRFLGAVGAGDGKYQQQYFNSVIDTFKLKTLEDARILNDPNLAAAALEDSFADARMIGLLRTAAQFILPTGPQVEYRAGDIDGKNWTFQALASEYYAILARNDYDNFEAYREFKARFGYDPTTFTTAKSVRTIKMSTTKTGDNWYRENQDLFDNNNFPTTAAYAMPDLPWDEFDYDAYNRQLEVDARQGVTPEVWQARRNQLLGGIQYENAKVIADDRTDKAASTWLRQIHQNLMDQYPGFGLQQIPGVPGRATIDQKILELEKWGSDPRLSDSNAGKGLAVYFDIRNQAQIRSMEHGFTPSGFQTAKKMEYIREWMRAQAASIMAQYPDFSTLWFDVFARELEEAKVEREPLSLGGVSFKDTA